MANRLAELEADLGIVRRPATRRQTGDSARGTIKATHPARRKARALERPVDYSVPGIVPVLRQPSGLTCWATVTTMMVSWKQGRSLPIETALEGIGQIYLNMFSANQGLSAAEKPVFLAAAGLVAEPPQNPSMEGWEAMLRRFGPLWVTTDEAQGPRWAIHARIMTGIHGDGTPGGTTIDLIDPAGGREYSERFTTFIRKFEEETRTTGRMRVQIVHWPHDAGFGLQQRLLRGEPRTRRAERHPERAFAAPVAAIELGLAVFSTGQSLLSGGDLSYEAAEASYEHPNTPPDTPAKKVNVDFVIFADHPRAGFDDQEFWFRLEFEHNGYDLRKCRIGLLRDQSSKMISSSFHVSFRPVGDSRPSDPEARILYMIDGRWDPIWRGDYSFRGELLIKADGSATLKIEGERNWVYIRKNAFTNRRATRLPTPQRITVYHDVLFAPAGSDRVTPAAERELLEWFERVSQSKRTQLEKGEIPILVHGHASTTGTVTENRELSRRRAENVRQILRDTLGGEARIDIRAHGERQAGTPDETEDPTKRRARVEITEYLNP